MPPRSRYTRLRGGPLSDPLRHLEDCDILANRPGSGSGRGCDVNHSAEPRRNARAARSQRWCGLGGGAFDPASGILYVKVNDQPDLLFPDLTDAEGNVPAVSPNDSTDFSLFLERTIPVLKNRRRSI